MLEAACEKCGKITYELLDAWIKRDNLCEECYNKIKRGLRHD